MMRLIGILINMDRTFPKTKLDTSDTRRSELNLDTRVDSDEFE